MEGMRDKTILSVRLVPGGEREVKHVHTTTDTVCLGSGLSMASGSLMRQPLNLGASWYRASVEEVVEFKAQRRHAVSRDQLDRIIISIQPRVTCRLFLLSTKVEPILDERMARGCSVQHDQCVVRLTVRNPGSVPKGSLRTHSARTCKYSLARQRVDWVDSASPLRSQSWLGGRSVHLFPEHKSVSNGGLSRMPNLERAYPDGKLYKYCLTRVGYYFELIALV